MNPENCDRRTIKRYLSTDHFNCELICKIANQKRHIKVRDMTHENLTVTLDQFSPERPKVDTCFKAIPLHVNNDYQGDLNLKINLISGDVVLLIPEDNESAALLWEAIYNYHSTYSIKQRDKIKKLVRSDLLPNRGQFSEEARLNRVKFIQQKTQTDISGVANTSIDSQDLRGNIEAYLGSIEIPIGLAGPIYIEGNEVEGLFYAPMATTEGALIDSVTRGSLAITKSGGVTTRVLGQRMMRVPLFIFANMYSALFFAEWVRIHASQIKSEAVKYSNHAQLMELEPHVIGRSVHVHFVYETGDASGQNMSTTCTWNTCLWILERLKHHPDHAVERFFIDGNLSNDKKVTFLSFVKGRGMRVIAEAFISERILSTILKTTPEQLFAAYQGVVAGATQAGMIGMNVNVANVIAAMFTALGQDIACVHESSIAHFHMEMHDHGIYVSVLLPSLVVGTVGGGTGLPQQRECLQILGCSGVGKAFKLAEIIAAFCLALDLSTLSAVSSGHFAISHERLGKNRPVNYLKIGDFDQTFFTRLFQNQRNDKSINVTQVHFDHHHEIGSSIVTLMTAEKVKKLLGHYAVRLAVTADQQSTENINIIMKIKPLDSEVIFMVNTVASVCDNQLAAEFKRANGDTGFIHCHTRELNIYRHQDECFTRITPKLYGIYEDKEREAYVLLMEQLNNMELMDSADDISGWTHDHIRCAIDDISSFHRLWYKKEDELQQSSWIGWYPTKTKMEHYTRLWHRMLVHTNNEFPEWFENRDLHYLRGLIDAIPEWWSVIEKSPKTLIHGDFNPRNIAFRKNENGLRLCAYDWELATIQIPQRDIVELLAFSLSPEEIHLSQLQYWSEYQRQSLSKACGEEIDKALWWQGFRYSFYDLLINRCMHYCMAHTAQHYEFMDRVMNNVLTIVCQELRNEEK